MRQRWIAEPHKHYGGSLPPSGALVSSVSIRGYKRADRFRLSIYLRKDPEAADTGIKAVIIVSPIRPGPAMKGCDPRSASLRVFVFSAKKVLTNSHAGVLTRTLLRDFDEFKKRARIIKVRFVQTLTNQPIGNFKVHEKTMLHSICILRSSSLNRLRPDLD